MIEKQLKIIEERNVLGKQFRIYGDFENPLFLAKDVADWLELTNVTDMVSRVDEDEVTKFNLGGLQGECNFLTENGLYEVLMQSRKPIAKEFKKEVKKILKSIRKHGIYATDKVIDDIINNPDFGIELLTRLKEERQARIEAERRNAVLSHVNKTYTATEIAKELGMKSAIELNKDLCNKGIQYKINDTYVLYSEYANLGFTEIKQQILDNGKVIYHRKFTQYGREFILTYINNNLKAGFLLGFFNFRY